MTTSKYPVVTSWQRFMALSLTSLFLPDFDFSAESQYMVKCDMFCSITKLEFFCLAKTENSTPQYLALLFYHYFKVRYLFQKIANLQKSWHIYIHTYIIYIYIYIYITYILHIEKIYICIHKCRRWYG